MITKIADRVFCILFLSAFVLGMVLIPSTNAVAQGSPWFAAHLSGNHVAAYNWPVGAILTLTIDDPNTPGFPDFVGTEIVPESDLYGGTWINFELPGFELRPGQYMTITDGFTTRTHTVKTVIVTSVDLLADTISGEAEPNSDVGVNAHYESGGHYVYRNFVADVNGNWMIDLSISGPNEGEGPTYDIVAESWGTAFQRGEDEGITYYAWSGNDTDGDSIADDFDNCPNENAFGYDADEDGCIDTASGLETLLQNMPADEVATNMKKSLLAVVKNATKSLNKGNVTAAIKQLEAFILRIEAQRGKKISELAADLLIAYAQNVIMLR